MSNTGKEYFLALGEALSLDVKPDEDGNCLLAVDNQMPVIVRANESAQRMELTASVADELPEGLAYSDMLDLLGIAIVSTPPFLRYQRGPSLYHSASFSSPYISFSLSM